MTEFAEPKAVALELPPDDAARWADANRQALHFMIGAQRMALEEMAFAADAMLDRARTETHLFGEFAAKLAGSHSVKDIRTMYADCARHQLDFLRRDSDRLFQHGGRVIEAASRLFDNRTQT